MGYIRCNEQLTIAVDFDDTFTADPGLWGCFINDARARGHRVICVTARQDSPSQQLELRTALGDGVEVLFADGRPKRLHAQSKGIDVDIWCDDMPEVIAPDSRVSALQKRIVRMQEQINKLTDERDVAREQRDERESETRAQLQKQMAELRKEIARLKSLNNAATAPASP